MTPAAGADEQCLDRQMERHMGCMAGFLQIFDRHQILAGKRLYPSKRLPSSSPVAGSTSPSERSDISVSSLFKPCPSPDGCPSSPEAASRPSLPLPVYDATRAAWKLREAPRLSLDSRAVLDAKGKLRPRGKPSEPPPPDDRRSPSVVARLMGIDALPAVPQLRRSASESRVQRDISHFRFVDPVSFQRHAPPDEPLAPPPDLKPSPPGGPPRLYRKSFFEARELYPEPKRAGSLYGEIERRLRMRGIDEPARDLETLKQILEALQLKGLLHHGDRHHLAAPARRDSPPIVVMRPAAARPPRRPGSEPPRARRSPSPEAAAPRRGRSPGSPDRNEVLRSPSSPARRRQMNEREPVRQAAPPPPLRRSSAAHSPKTSPRRLAPEPLPVRSPRNRRSQPSGSVSPKTRIFSPPVDDDSSTTLSESSVSNSSLFDFERTRTDEYKAGRNLLERCDKLLSSIAAFTSSPAAAEQVTAVDQQPSPVSVLDSSPFLADDSPSPSPITKRSIDFQDRSAELDNVAWTTTRFGGAGHVDDGGADLDFLLVSEILSEASDRRRGLSDVYLSIEKRHRDATGAERLHRRMLFDAVVEILDRKRDLPSDGPDTLRQVWAEVRRMRDGAVAGDLNEVTCAAIRKDLAVERGWGDHCPVEVSEAVLHIERQIYKDLVGEAIQELADVAAGKAAQLLPLPRRKLMF